MCGHEFPVKVRELTQREGELKELRRLDALDRIEKRRKGKRLAEREPCLNFGPRQEKGYKPGWAYKIFYGRRY